MHLDASARRSALAAALAIVVLAVVATSVTRAASLRQSATFDEIILVSGGARAVTHGAWGMITDQPPLMMWLYGWAVTRGAVDLPPEDREWSFDDRWDYARMMFFGSGDTSGPGNDAQALLGRARLVTAVMAGVLVAAAGGFGWWVGGALVGVLSAVVTAFLPDVLAHGGVAYNDLPLALAFLLAVWAMDATVRRPTLASGGLTGVALGAAFGMKMSALALLPIALVLFGCEAWARWRDRPWRRAVGSAVVTAILSGYVTLVVMYDGDPTLTLLRFNFWRTVLHAAGGHEAPAFLLGQTSAGGWWYYFPVAFLFKVPVAFQVSVVVAGGVLVRALWASDRRAAWLTASRGRAAVVGVLVFGAFLLRSDLNAGFRYALPALPLLAVAVAAGLGCVWSRSRVARSGVVVLLAVQAASVLSSYPHFLAYSSAWAGGRDASFRLLSDSNVDWGQGLLELRSFMRDEGVASVRLSYFGSARPEAYGIDYVALPSFFRLAQERTPGAEANPRFTVISATNLQGLYLQGRDPFAAYRKRTPYRVLGHALFVYDEGERGLVPFVPDG